MNSLHPATYMPTKMVLDSVGYSIDSLNTGLSSTLRLINDPTLEAVSGRFYGRTTETHANPTAYRTDLQQHLWRVSEQLTTP